MDKKIGISYRTVLREVHLLKEAGLVEIKRKEPSKTKGKARNIWKPTFAGILCVLSWLQRDAVSVGKIARANKNEWLIFQEWDYISQSSTSESWIVQSLNKLLN